MKIQLTTTQIYSSHAQGLEEDGWKIYDVTVKSGDKYFAPTWDMVMGYKRGTVSEKEYTRRYHKMMKESFLSKKDVWETLLYTYGERGLALACYCRPEDFCHRHLLLDYLKRTALYWGHQVEVIDELEVPRAKAWLKQHQDLFSPIPEGYLPDRAVSGSTVKGRKIVVAGGRDFSDYNQMKTELSSIIKEGDSIISGTARGADSLGERYAKEKRLSVFRKPANWEKYGKSAGYRRNEEMAKEGDVLCAFWDGKSRGTKHMIDLARKYGLEVHIFNY